MRILLSNDDGYFSPGLERLAADLAAYAEITVVAPERDRSGASNSLTLDRPLTVRRAPNGFLFVNGTPITLMFYVADVDAQFARAVAAGGEVKRPLKDQFYGDRSGTIVDPSGHMWTIATHKEDVSPEEMDRRMKAMMSGDQK